MATGGTADPFALFSPKIVTELEDQNRFIEVMTEFYLLMANKNGCHITTSDRRFADAHDYWNEDAERMLAQSHPDTRSLDHFKHGSLIAFWLRRLVPINDIYFSNENSAAKAPGGKVQLAGIRATEQQIKFAQYGSELCALYAGFYICLSYEVQRVQAGKSAAANVIVLGADPVSSAHLPPQFREEYAMLMKTKNISAHGLYMVYCALFSDIQWRVRRA